MSKNSKTVFKVDQNIYYVDYSLNQIVESKNREDLPVKQVGIQYLNITDELQRGFRLDFADEINYSFFSPRLKSLNEKRVKDNLPSISLI